VVGLDGSLLTLSRLRSRERLNLRLQRLRCRFLEMNFQSLCSGRDTLAVQRGEITYEMLITPRPKRRRKACWPGLLLNGGRRSRNSRGAARARGEPRTQADSV
jgi:hypothetical protein